MFGIPWWGWWAVLGGGLLVWWGVRRYLASLGVTDGMYGTIEAITGRPRQGKSTYGTQLTLQRARLRNAVICSNIAITDPDGVLETHLIGNTEDGLDIRQLLPIVASAKAEGRGVVLFVDEVGISFPARFWQKFGIVFMFLLQQSGKLYMELIWATQSVRFADAQLREVTAATHVVRASPPATVSSRLKGQRPKFITIDTYDQTAVGVADAYLGRRRMRYRREFEACFDTDAMVMPPLKFKGAADLVELLGELGLTVAPLEDVSSGGGTLVATGGNGSRGSSVWE